MAKKTTNKTSKKSDKVCGVELTEAKGQAVVSPALVKAVRAVLTEEVCDGKGNPKLNERGKPLTVSARVVAQRLLKDFAVDNEQMFYLIVNVAIATGAVPGFTSRTGRDGGIFRIPAAE